MKLHNRLIKTGFWTDADIIKALPPEGRLFFVGLWVIADDSGCVEDDPFAFKVLVFPGDANITAEMLEGYRDVLVREGKLIPYEVGGKKCLYIKNFHKHQTLKNCPPPEVPLPPWIRWEPFESNPRAGKYVVLEDVLQSSYGHLMNVLQNSYDGLTNVLQVSSNLTKPNLTEHNINKQNTQEGEVQEGKPKDERETPPPPPKGGPPVGLRPPSVYVCEPDDSEDEEDGPVKGVFGQTLRDRLKNRDFAKEDAEYFATLHKRVRRPSFLTSTM